MTYTLIFFGENYEDYSIYLIPDNIFDDLETLKLARKFIYSFDVSDETEKASQDLIYIFYDKYNEYYIGTLDGEDPVEDITDKSISHVYFV